MTHVPPVDELQELARVELLQGVDRGREEVRHKLYHLFSASDGEPFPDMARRAYEQMTLLGGIAASVADQLSVELDILENPEPLCAIAGIDPDVLQHTAGTWWSPSARWFFIGPELLEVAGYHDPGGEHYEAAAQLLLDDSAEALARFYATVAQGAERVLGVRLLRPPRFRSRKQIAFVGEVARQRSLLFHQGPMPRGGYLERESVDEEELREALWSDEDEADVDSAAHIGDVRLGADERRDDVISDE